MHSVLLRYIDEVARQGSIRKAANVLNVSSTSINRKIISAETRFGIRLFERSSEGVELTPAGKIVLEHCRKTLYDFEQVRILVDDIRDVRTGHLSIQTLDSVTFGILPKIMEQFSARYPGVSLSIRTDVPEEIMNAVASGNTDIGITFTKDMHPGARVVLEKAAPFGIVVPPSHPLAERTNVSTEDMIGYPLVRTTDARSRNSILDLELEAAAVPLMTHIFTNALVIAKQAILSNQGIGIYTKVGFIKEVDAGELKFVPFSAMSLKEYKIGIITAANVGVDPLKRTFFDVAARIFKSMSFDS